MAPQQDNLARKITIIPASAPNAVKLRVAAYCRVSSDSEDQLNSFATQNSYYSSLFSNKENLTLVDIYADEGITGTSAEKREDFQRLMCDCRQGKIDKVYAKSISRFARNTKDCLEATRELKTMGIGVVFEEQHIDTSVVSGEMLTAVFAACAQAESESISKNVRWGIQKRMQNGTFLPSHQPFGYEIREKQICINVPEARFVCEIFQRYLLGENTAKIAAYLNELQSTYPELREHTWTYKSVARLLRNEKYTGDSVWQKTYRTESLPRREFANRGEAEQYRVSNTHPPIISREAYILTQALLTQRGKNRAGETAAQNHYCGKMICGCCGSNFRGKKIRGVSYRVCRTHSENTMACDQQPVLESEVKQAFLRLYYKLKKQGMVMLSEMAENLETARQRQMLWHPDIIEINKRISNISNQSHKLAMLNQQGAVDSDVFISKTNQLAEQLRIARREKEKILQQREDDTLRKTREVMDIIDCGPGFLDSFDEELFLELIDKVIVESGPRIRFCLINGLELPESIERTVR